MAALATAWLPRVTPELVRETSKPLRRNPRAQNLQAPRKSKICGHKNLRVRKICRSSDVVSTHAKSAGGKICPGSGFGNIYGASVLKLCVAFCGHGPPSVADDHHASLPLDARSMHCDCARVRWAAHATWYSAARARAPAHGDSLTHGSNTRRPTRVQPCSPWASLCRRRSPRAPASRRSTDALRLPASGMGC